MRRLASFFTAFTLLFGVAAIGASPASANSVAVAIAQPQNAWIAAELAGTAVTAGAGVTLAGVSMVDTDDGGWFGVPTFDDIEGFVNPVTKFFFETDGTATSGSVPMVNQAGPTVPLAGTGPLKGQIVTMVPNASCVIISGTTCTVLMPENADQKARVDYHRAQFPEAIFLDAVGTSVFVPEGSRLLTHYWHLPPETGGIATRGGYDSPAELFAGIGWTDTNVTTTRTYGGYLNTPFLTTGERFTRFDLRSKAGEKGTVGTVYLPYFGTNSTWTFPTGLYRTDRIVNGPPGVTDGTLFSVKTTSLPVTDPAVVEIYGDTYLQDLAASTNVFYPAELSGGVQGFLKRVTPINDGNVSGLVKESRVNSNVEISDLRIDVDPFASAARTSVQVFRFDPYAGFVSSSTVATAYLSSNLAAGQGVVITPAGSGVQPANPPVGTKLEDWFPTLAPAGFNGVAYWATTGTDWIDPNTVAAPVYGSIEIDLMCRNAAGDLSAITQTFSADTSIGVVDIPKVSCPSGSLLIDGSIWLVKPDGSRTEFADPYQANDIAKGMPQDCIGNEASCTLMVRHVLDDGSTANCLTGDGYWRCSPRWWFSPTRAESYQCVYGSNAAGWQQLQLLSCAVWANPSGSPTITKELQVEKQDPQTTTNNYIFELVPVEDGIPNPWATTAPTPEPTTGTDPATDPDFLADPIPNPTPIDPRIVAENPPTSPTPSDPLVDSPTANNCSNFSLLSVLNPAEYVRGGKCVLQWAFIPSSGAGGIFNNFKQYLEGGGFGRMVGVVASFIQVLPDQSSDDCKGPAVTLPDLIPGSGTMQIDTIYPTETCDGIGKAANDIWMPLSIFLIWFTAIFFSARMFFAAFNMSLPFFRSSSSDSKQADGGKK